MITKKNNPKELEGIKQPEYDAYLLSQAVNHVIDRTDEEIKEVYHNLKQANEKLRLRLLGMGL